MTDAASLLAAIQREPDSDTLRLIYADWLDDQGDPGRAEFIRVQIESERHPAGSPEHVRLTGRALELLLGNGGWADGYETGVPDDAILSAHRAELATEHGILLLKGQRNAGESYWREIFSKLWFRRGFVEEVDLTARQFFAHGPTDIWPTGPPPTLRLCLGNEGYHLPCPFAECIARLATAPLLDRFDDFCLDGGFGSTNAEGLRLLAGRPTLLAKLAGLNLSEDSVGDAEVLAILESPYLTRLRELALDFTNCTPAVVERLIRSDRFRGTTYLHLGGMIEEARGVRLFAAPGRWPRLRWLSLADCGLTGLTLRGLMRPGAFPALEVFDLCSNAIHVEGARALLLSAAFPRLRKLGVGGTPLTLAEVQTLREEFGHRVEIFYPVPRTSVSSSRPENG